MSYWINDKLAVRRWLTIKNHLTKQYGITVKETKLCKQDPNDPHSGPSSSETVVISLTGVPVFEIKHLKDLWSIAEGKYWLKYDPQKLAQAIDAGTLEDYYNKSVMMHTLKGETLPKRYASKLVRTLKGEK